MRVRKERRTICWQIIHKSNISLNDLKWFEHVFGWMIGKQQARINHSNEWDILRKSQSAYRYLVAMNLLGRCYHLRCTFRIQNSRCILPFSSFADAISREKGIGESPWSITIGLSALEMKCELIILTSKHVYYSEAARRADSHININLWVPRATRKLWHCRCYSWTTIRWQWGKLISLMLPEGSFA